MSSTLPGLPQPAPAPDPQPERTPLQMAQVDLDAAVIELVMHARKERPEYGPAEVVMQTVLTVVDTLAQLAPPVAIRTGLLSAFEETHQQPMTFIDIGRAKKALELMADKRRKAEQTTAGGIILPGKE